MLAYMFKFSKENLVYKEEITKIMNVDFKSQVIFCWPKAQSSMSTLRPKSNCVDIKCNFCVDLLNFDLNNPNRAQSFKTFMHLFRRLAQPK